ncbi:MAG: hypothetical protein MIN69_19905 [Methylorubrum extorquens]|uniref:hypothetical protein n=1 Tax=Methylorubrum extorquens TaxID=408 RepID=UPI002FEDF805
MLAKVTDALADAAGSDPVGEIFVDADANIEMISRLVDDAWAGRANAFPGAVLLPPGSVEDRLRRLRAWPGINPAETVAWLGLDEGHPGRRFSPRTTGVSPITGPPASPITSETGSSRGYAIPALPENFPPPSH